jgi:aminoglycoside phosphotransferase family enzyme/predicted kinase
MTAAVVETHSSTLFFVDDRVYKRKRPLNLGFSDFRTQEARLSACREEVRLNRRMSPDVYLGVADVIGPDGSACDHFVVMRRLPDDRRLATLVSAGTDVDEVLRSVAVQLTRLHEQYPAPPALQAQARAPALGQLWSQGTAELASFPDLLPEDIRQRTSDLAVRWLAGRGPLLDARVADGRVYDGHGDLLADDIFVLADGPRVLDCLEFDERLRVCDGIADAAFLAMDLERLGAPAAGRLFLGAYRAAAHDDPPTSLEHFYLAYRAHVRCKVTCIRARQSPTAENAALARQFAELALTHLQQGRIRLVVLGGLPGSGKTTVATGLGEAAGWVHLSSDRTRKGLAGRRGKRDGAVPFRTGLYSPNMTARTYQALLAEARTALQGGFSVVLDASFVDQRWRELARVVARDSSADLTEMRCATSGHVADARIRQRMSSVSDATPEVRRELALDADPWPEARTLGTTVPVEETLRAAWLLISSPEDLLAHDGQ